MSLDPPSSMANGGNAEAEIPVDGSISTKKNPRKVPKKIHKAEREKLKRDHLNELFVELGHALEPARQNNGKASILGDATRLLRDLVTQMESLRKEHDALVTESLYVTTEKNELREENTVLESEISRLQHELREKMHSDPLWCNGTDTTPAAHPQPTSTALPMPQPSVGPLYVIPIPHDLQPHPEVGTAPAPINPPTNVRRPHARYPTPSDSWPLELLSRNPRTAQEAQHSSTSTGTSNTSTSGEDSSDKSLASSS